MTTHNVLEKFTGDAGQGNWSVILWQVNVTLLENWSDPHFFPVIRNCALCERLVEQVTEARGYVISQLF